MDNIVYTIGQKELEESLDFIEAPDSGLSRAFTITLDNHEPIPDWIVFDDDNLTLVLQTDEPEDVGEYKLVLTTNFHTFPS